MKTVVNTKVKHFAGNEYSSAKTQVIRMYSDSSVTVETFDTNGDVVESHSVNKHFYNIYAYGIENVKTAQKFIGNSCVRGIYHHGKRIAQMEDVLEDLVYIGYIDPANVGKVIEQIARLGFTGLCDIEKDWDNCYQETICAVEF